MNTKLVDSLAQIIKSLTLEEKMLLEQKIQRDVNQNLALLDNNNDDLDKWAKKLQKWSELHPRNIPLLSDYDVSRGGIYEED